MKIKDSALNFPFFKHIWNRTHIYNKMWTQVNTGDTREGKDWCLLTQFSILDKTFDASRVAFSVKEFLDALDIISKNAEGKRMRSLVLCREGMELCQCGGYLSLIGYNVPGSCLSP